MYKWGYYWDQYAIIQSWAAKWAKNNARLETFNNRVQYAKNKYYIGPCILSKYGMEYKYHISQYNPKTGIFYSEAAEWFREQCLVRIGSTNEISIPRTNIVL